MTGYCLAATLNIKIMKKISLLAACIAVITTFFSCSKDKDQYPSPSTPHTAQGCSKTSGNNNSVILNGLYENTTSKFGGGDDDKPIIMHRLVNPEFGRLQNVVVKMINNADSLQSLTNSAGECTFELPHVGNWELKIALAGFFSVDTLISVTDSFSLRTTYLDNQ
jgi:hypothetical protein